MRIRRLDLLRFGPFTDVPLSFDCVSSGLHVVYGPNEAGKSSALRALRQLLYGIPHNSADNFTHPHQNLRIGALLENSDGQTLEFIRRKGRTQTLRDGNDAEAVDPDCLERMLGGIDEAVFTQRFGIDYEELRKGGEAVVQGGGELGEMLFAAGAGVADLGKVQKRLADEADELYKPRGSLQRINTAIKGLNEVRRQTKESQLLTSEWVKHEKGLRQATQRKDDIDKQLLNQKSEQSRLERIAEALPLISQRQRLRDQHDGVADAALLPDDFSGTRRESVAQLKTAEQALADAKNAVAKLRESMDELKIPEELLAHRTAITRLHTELGSFQKAAKDRPGLVAKLEQAEQTAKNILCEMGRGPNLDEANGLRITRIQRQKIQKLASDCKALLGKKDSADQSLRDLSDEIQQIELQLSKIVACGDSGELNRVVRRVQQRGDLDQQLKDARELQQQLERQTKVDLQKLRLWQGTLDELERLPVPALETVDRFENELADAQNAADTLRQQCADSTAQIRRLDQKLETLRLERDVPTEDDLAIARQQRDAGWQLVLRCWRESSADHAADINEFVARFAPGGDLAGAFQTSIEGADQIGDRLRREADRVAEKAKLSADRKDLTRRLELQQQESQEAIEHLEDLRNQWRDQWSGLDIDPLSPREMRSWLSQQTTLAVAAASLRKQHDAVTLLEDLIQSQRSALNQCLAELDQPLAGDDETLSALLGRCEDVVAEIQAAARHHQDLENNLPKLRTKLTSAEQDAEQASRAVEQWTIDWAKAVEKLGVDRDADPLLAMSAIESLDDLFLHIKDANDTRMRIEGIDRDAEQFTKSVTHLLSQVAPDLLESPVDQSVADLIDRLEAASIAQTKLDGWREHLQQEETKQQQAGLQVLRWQTTIETMCQDAGCDTLEELPDAERRSAARKEVESKSREADEQLVRLCGGAPLNDFVAEALREDSDQITAKLDRLTDEIGRLETEKPQVSETIGAARAELGRMDGSGQAAECREQAEHLLARIRNDAEQYIRLRTASIVLRKSIERFREQSQGPVLQRASELFAELTLGSFAGLRADYDSKDNAVLVGVRPDGQRTVGVQGMSEGTCDQLYLSLRLSLLETHLAHREPMPFIVDDILIKFDNDRAVAALRALARLSEKTQVIFFTHHEHVARLARENLDDNFCIHDFHHCHTAPRQQEPARA